jgi:RNA polymerase sigma factor (sigma-70 family)
VTSSYHPLGCLSLDRLVERFAIARDHGDAPAARQLWGAIAVKLDDRLKVFVRSLVIPNTAGERLHPDDRDEALQRARRRVWFKLGATFNGVSVGELHNAARKGTWYACTDVARERMRQEQRTRRSRRIATDDHDELDRLSRAQATHTFERAGELAELKDRLDRAMALMKNPTHREVLMLDRLGVPDDEIAQRLGITRDNVYQRRKRGLTNLKELLNDAPA